MGHAAFVAEHANNALKKPVGMEEEAIFMRIPFIPTDSRCNPY
jgi:hypothetical protein